MRAGRRIAAALVLGAVICASPVQSQTAAEPTDAGKAAGIPYKEEKAETTVGIWNTLFAFLIAVGIGGAGIYGIKRYQWLVRPRSSKTARLAVVEHLRLSARTNVYLCRVDDALYLVAQSGDHVAVTPHAPRDRSQAAAPVHGDAMLRQ